MSLCGNWGLHFLSPRVTKRGCCEYFVLNNVKTSFQLKQHGKELISQMRGRLIGLIKEGLSMLPPVTLDSGHGSKRNWKGSVEEELYHFNDNIYKAFKEQYVR